MSTHRGVHPPQTVDWYRVETHKPRTLRDGDSYKEPRYERDAHSSMRHEIQAHERANSIKAPMTIWQGDYFSRCRSDQRNVPVTFILSALKTVYCHIGACDWSGERNTNQPCLQMSSTGADVSKRRDVEVVPHSPSVRTKRSAGVQHLCTRKHVTSPRLQTSTTTLMQALRRVGALMTSSPWMSHHTRGSGRTSTIHGCPHAGRLWMAQIHLHPQA